MMPPIMGESFIVRLEDRAERLTYEPRRLGAAYFTFTRRAADRGRRPTPGQAILFESKEAQHRFPYTARVAEVSPDDFYQQFLYPTAESVRTVTFRDPLGVLAVAFDPSLKESPSSESILELYEAELAKVREEQRAEEALRREQQRVATAYVEEAIALANPIALRLLGWLYYDGELPLQNVLNAFGDSPDAFECTSRLHFLGALRFDRGRLSITSLGEKILREFDLLNDDSTE